MDVYPCHYLNLIIHDKGKIRYERPKKLKESGTLFRKMEWRVLYQRATEPS